MRFLCRQETLRKSITKGISEHDRVKTKYNKRLQVAFTHAQVHMGASVYSPGPEES